MSNKVPRSRRQKPEAKDPILGIREETVSSNLLLYKPAIWFVLIERADNIITIRPRIWPQLVFIVATGIRILGHVQSVSGEALSIARRGK